MLYCDWSNVRMVQGVWGVVPIHLLELSPDHLRAFVIGTTYQLGNLVSSASSTIEATLGERFPLAPGPGGVARYDYGKVMGMIPEFPLMIAIFMGAVYGFLILVMVFGPERMNHDLIMTDRIEGDAYTRKEEEIIHDSMAETIPKSE